MAQAKQDDLQAVIEAVRKCIGYTVDEKDKLSSAKGKIANLVLTQLLHVTTKNDIRTILIAAIAINEELVKVAKYKEASESIKFLTEHRANLISPSLLDTDPTRKYKAELKVATAFLDEKALLDLQGCKTFASTGTLGEMLDSAFNLECLRDAPALSHT